MYFIINFITVLLFYFLEFAVTAIMPLFITEYLHFDKSYSGIFTGAFSCAAMSAKFFSGAAADKFGKINLYRVALLFSGITILFYGNFTGIGAVFLIIFFHGLASGVFRSLIMSVTVSLVSKKFIGTALGVVGVAITVAMMAGAVFSAIFIKNNSYEEFFYFLFILYLGATLFTLLLKVNDVKNHVPLKLSSFIEKDVIPLALLRFSGAICYGLFLSYGIIHGKEVGGFNPGVVITIYAAANIFSRPISGYILDKFKPVVPLLLPYIVLFAGYFMFSRMDMDLVLAGAFLIGVGSGMEYTTIGSVAFKRVKNVAFNRVSSTLELFFSLGIALSATVSGLLFSGSLSTIFTFSAATCIIPIISLSIYYGLKHSNTKSDRIP